MKDKFPFDHTVDCIQKIIRIKWHGNGQIGRYGVPYLINKFYPGYNYEFVSEDFFNSLNNQKQI